MRATKSLMFIIAATSLFYTSCKKDTPNQVPTADAGQSKAITLPVSSVTLTGSGTDADGKVVAYLWSQISGPAATTIINPGATSTEIDGFIQGNYVFQLMVTDDKGATGVDTCVVLVNPNPIKTVTIQPNNNPNEVAVTVLNGVNTSGLTGPSLEADAWTSGGNPWTLRGYVKFDLSNIPTNAIIQSANLYLYSNPTPTTGDQVNANSGSSNSFTVQQVTASWAPGTIGWFNQPTATTTNQIVVPQSTQSFQDLNLDVTAMVANMVANNSNYGFVLKLQNEVTYNSRIFVASHNQTYPDKHPKLVIVYK